MNIIRNHATYVFPRWRGKLIKHKGILTHEWRHAEHALAEPRCCAQHTGEYAAVYLTSGEPDHMYLYMGNES